jgi:uncharacterized spore protein YtfJ
MSKHQFDFLETLSEKLRSSASIQHIYGEPIDARGKTVIPVARVAYGLGGGYGKVKAKESTGSTSEPSQEYEQPTAPEQPAESGGGGITVTPVGVFEISEKHTRFISMPDRKRDCTIALLIGFVLGLLLKIQRK